MKLFEYAVYKDEKRDDKDNITDPASMLVEPTTMLANDDKQVGMIASRAIADEHMDDLDRIQIVVRPF